jgi:hypothetical protein
VERQTRLGRLYGPSRRSGGRSDDRQLERLLWRQRGWRDRVVVRTIRSFDRRTNLRHTGPCVVHLHRVTRDIEADASRHAMRIPDWPPVRLPSLDEAIIVAAVPGALTAAETGHVVQNLRVPCGERIHRPDDLGWARCRIGTNRQGSQLPRVTRGHRRQRNAGRPRNFRRLRRCDGGMLLQCRGILARRFVAATSGTCQRPHGDDHQRPRAPLPTIHPESLTLGWTPDPRAGNLT